MFLLFVVFHRSHFYDNHHRHVACYALFTPADLSATKSDRHVCPTKPFVADAKTSVSDASRIRKEAATVSARRVMSLTKMFVGTGRFVGPILSPSVDGGFAVCLSACALCHMQSNKPKFTINLSSTGSIDSSGVEW